MSDTTKVGLEIDVVSDDAVKNVKGTESALNSLMQSMQKVQQIGSRPFMASSSNLIRTQNQAWVANRIVAEMDRESRAMKDLQIHAMSLGMSEDMASEFSRKYMEQEKDTSAVEQGRLRGLSKAFQGTEELVVAGAAAISAAVVAMGAAIVGAIGYATWRFGEAAAEMAMHSQTARSAIQQLLHGGTAAEAASEFNDIRRMSEELGLSVEGTTESFQALLRMQFKPEIAKDIIKMGADLQAVGVNAEEVQGVITAMSQIKAKGRLQSEELMQLQERGVSGELVQDALMKRLGISDKRIYQQKLQGGQISSDVALGAIQDAIMKKTGESALGEAGSRYASTTIAGQMNVMKAQWSNLLIDAGDAMMPGLTRITKSVGSIFDQLSSSPAVQHLGASLLAAFERFSVWLETNWPSIAATAESMFELLADGVDILLEGLDWLNENSEMVTTTLYGLGIVLGAVVAVVAVGAALILGPMLIALGAIIGVVVAIVAWIGFLFDTAKELFTAAYEWFGMSASEWGANIVSGLVDGIFGSLGTVVDAAHAIWNAVENTFTGDAEINSPSKVATRWGVYTGSGVSGGILSTLSDVEGASRALVDAAMPGGVAANDNGGGPRVQGAVASVGDAVAGAKASAARGGVVININLVVQAPKGGTREDGERYGQGVGAGIQRELHRYLSEEALTGT